MKSEEALEDLFDLLCEREHTNSEHTFWLKLYQEVKKDLEVLEILKKHMWFSFHKELGFQVFCNDTIDLGNEEEFKMLKEWLELV